MNDEIKEKIPYNVRNILEDVNSNILWNYITNLQQENERLKEYYDLMVQFNQKNLDRFCDYKSRCEKAIEYIKSEKEHYLTKGCLIADTNNANLIVSAVVNTCDCSLNILQNGGK